MPPSRSALAAACAALLALPGQAAAEEGFLAGARLDLQTRTYYFSREFPDAPAGAPSRAEETAQGLILDFRSGYTPGPVGVGLDALGLLGVKLDSAPHRTRTGLLPVEPDGRAADRYGRLGPTLKLRASQTELKIGELRPNIPVLVHSDIRLLPPTYQGAALFSTDIPGLQLGAGQLRSARSRDASGTRDMFALISNGASPGAKLPGSDSDRFHYLGGDYAFGGQRTTASYWLGRLDDIYLQQFVGLKHKRPVGDWTLGANLGHFDTRESGAARAGRLRNQASYGQLTAARGGHSVLLGLQKISGETSFIRLDPNISALGNEVPTYEFGTTGERSWQVRYDFDFARIGIPGLTAGVRYIDSSGARLPGVADGEAWERDFDLAYAFPDGPLKHFGLRLRNVAARSNFRTDIDENRVIVTYTRPLL
ncbi:OprD family porin [Luteimonas sp. Y-2-2-4F]|nr:OprD family porin [Luteimonas sp. Y-2-2-4F]MCD9031237.1 OprD family porin [Luteimonas sp. Y-2-2-4F]